MTKRLLLLALLLLAGAAPTRSTDAANELRAFVRGSWSEIRKAHAGEPLVVHFWGVTCGPCRVEMPNWGKLLHERRDMRLVLINADLVPNEPKAALAMLNKAGLAGAENWTFSEDFVERLRYEIRPKWRGEIPLTLLLARDGSITEIEGVADLAEIRTWLDGQAAQQ
jgi:thiol-disulfide isomerase/thioredoxin